MLKPFFALAVLLLSVNPVLAETFVFRELGLSFQGPEGWHVFADAAFRREAGKADYGSDELNQQIQNTDENKLLSLLRDPVSVGVNPGVHVYLYPGDVPNFGVGLQRAMAYLEKNTESFELLEGPIEDKLADFPSGYIRYRYIARSQGSAFAVEELLWIAPMSERYLVISTGTAPDESTSVKHKIWEAVHSLRTLN